MILFLKNISLSPAVAGFFVNKGEHYTPPYPIAQSHQSQ